MKAVITGITGQDGAYLAAYLLKLGYEVVGIERRHSGALKDSRWRLIALGIEHRVKYVYGDITDQGSMESTFYDEVPDEIYNLAAQSFVGASWKIPIATLEATGMGAIKLMEAARKACPSAKVYQASSSEMFGAVQEVPQSESTRFNPRSPYGTAKCLAHHYAQNCRDSYGQFVATGILFNHESPLRGEEFVTRKITKAVARIKYDKQKYLIMGTLVAKRDWGHAQDYVRAMHAMLQKDKPNDFVIATGKMHSIQDFVIEAFRVAGFPEDAWFQYVKHNKEFDRPAEVMELKGNFNKAALLLDWAPEIPFKGLVADMVWHDMNAEKPLCDRVDPNAVLQGM